jgi:two-component system OmpR family response regulator
MTIASTAAENARGRFEDRPPRVLVVDDEESLADLLTLALQYEGWEVRSAGSGSEALRIAEEFAPDAVLLDLLLPDFNGIEVVRRLRAGACDVPVLFLSARDEAEDRSAGLSAGAQGYLTKPFSLDDVVSRIRAMLNRPADAGR